MRTITKRLLSLVLTLAMLLSLGLTVQAVNTAVTVTLNGTALELEAPAYIDGQDRTQVPASIGPQLGLTVQTGDGSVTFTKGEASLTFQDGAKEAGGVTMDTAADLSGEVGYVAPDLSGPSSSASRWPGTASPALRRSLARPRRRRPL